MPHSIPFSESSQGPTKRAPIPRSVKAMVWFFTQGQCWYCGGYVNPFETFCIDHFVPLARGGSNEVENLVPCCSYCNSQKGTKLVEEWRQNFSIADELDEEPWIDPSGVFWFERDGFFEQHRAHEIMVYRRTLAREQRERQ